MLIVFTRHTGGDSTALIHRADRVVVELRSVGRKASVPHDLVHAVTERELGFSRGVFGTIASGGMFVGMRVVSGRPRHDAAARSERVLKANGRHLTVAELLAAAVHGGVEHGRDAFSQARSDWGIVDTAPFPWTGAQVRSAVDTLRELAGVWATVAPGGGLELTWPDRLTEPVPAAPVTRRR